MINYIIPTDRSDGHFLRTFACLLVVAATVLRTIVVPMSNYIINDIYYIRIFIFHSDFSLAASLLVSISPGFVKLNHTLYQV